MEPGTARSHELKFQDRAQGKMTGISDVYSFDDHEILLATTAGMLTIRGNGAACEPALSGGGGGRCRRADRQSDLFRLGKKKSEGQGASGAAVPLK